MKEKWNLANTKLLFSQVDECVKSSRPIAVAFTRTAEKLGLSVNGVRAHYYSQLKFFDMFPQVANELGVEITPVKQIDFTLFTPVQVDELIQTILIKRVSGRSVRSVIGELAQGNEKTALRYQNKYRSMITTHRDRVEKITKTMREQGKTYFDPYLKRVVDGDFDAGEISAQTVENLSKMSKSQKQTALKILLSEN